jgi:hypothetical protein
MSDSWREDCPPTIDPLPSPFFPPHAHSQCMRRKRRKGREDIGLWIEDLLLGDFYRINPQS